MMRLLCSCTAILIMAVHVNGEIFERTSKYPLPYYNDVAPCPCDLTENKCDSLCCCDQVRTCILLSNSFQNAEAIFHHRIVQQITRETGLALKDSTVASIQDFSLLIIAVTNLNCTIRIGILYCAWRKVPHHTWVYFMKN